MTTLDRTTEAPARSAAQRLLHPRTILVTGVSERAGTLGRRVLGKVLRSGYAGQVLALGRTPATVDGVEVVTGFDQLPDGIDLALLGVPAAGVADAVRECGAHGIGAVVCYASGYAERGEDGAREQAELARLAEAGGVGLVGPNCFGFASTPDHLSAMMADIPDFPGVGPGTEGCATTLAPARLSTTTVWSDCTSFDSRAKTWTRLLPGHSGMSASKSIFVRSPERRFG